MIKLKYKHGEGSTEAVVYGLPSFKKHIRFNDDQLISINGPLQDLIKSLTDGDIKFSYKIINESDNSLDIKKSLTPIKTDKKREYKSLFIMDNEQVEIFAYDKIDDDEWLISFNGSPMIMTSIQVMNQFIRINEKPKFFDMVQKHISQLSDLGYMQLYVLYELGKIDFKTKEEIEKVSIASVKVQYKDEKTFLTNLIELINNDIYVSIQYIIVKPDKTVEAVLCISSYPK
jgi:hypothetical protein